MYLELKYCASTTSLLFTLNAVSGFNSCISLTIIQHWGAEFNFCLIQIFGCGIYSCATFPNDFWRGLNSTAAWSRLNAVYTMRNSQLCCITKYIYKNINQLIIVNFLCFFLSRVQCPSANNDDVKLISSRGAEKTRHSDNDVGSAGLWVWTQCLGWNLPLPCDSLQVHQLAGGIHWI